MWQPGEGPADLLQNQSHFAEPYVECGPLPVALLSNVTLLDLNGDGKWEYEEAVRLGSLSQQKYMKSAKLSVVFRRFLRLAEQGKLLAQQHADADSGITEWDQLTDQFKNLPMQWMHKEQKRINLCAVVDSKLCGNLEARGILKDKLDRRHDDEVSAIDRIDRCRETLQDFCDDIFGQLFETYRSYTHQSCGDVTRDWNDKLGILTLEYSKAFKYADSCRSISSVTYKTFLTLMVAVWLMCLMDEARKVVDWWAVIPQYNVSKEKGTGRYVVDETTGSITIQGIPRWHKWFTCLCNLLPRTFICVNLGVTGTGFLMSSDSYVDLVLNSVALSFLVEFDEMLFSAVADAKAKESVQICNSPCVPLNRLGFMGAMSTAFSYCKHIRVGSLAGTILICAIALACVEQVYSGPFGKYAVGNTLRCLCHIEGRDCLSAQLLGGEPVMARVDDSITCSEVWNPAVVAKKLFLSLFQAG